MRIIPAFAGNTIHWSLEWIDGEDHPRIRGEHAAFKLSLYTPIGSSPHSRGTLFTGVWSGLTGRIIPAFAGNTVVIRILTSPAGDHPRIRGEHPKKVASILSCQGSSPHSRGTPSPRTTISGFSRIIPAFAGNTVGNQAQVLWWWDHPRIRGEHIS